MKAIRIEVHPFSVLLGAVVAGGVLVLSSMVSAAASETLVIEGIPTPRQMMRIVEGQPFTVPAAHWFVATAVGIADGSSGKAVNKFEIRFDGTSVLRPRNSEPDHGALSPLAPGLAAGPGTVVSMHEQPGSETSATAVLLGYLAPQS